MMSPQVRLRGRRARRCAGHLSRGSADDLSSRRLCPGDYGYSWCRHVGGHNATAGTSTSRTTGTTGDISHVVRATLAKWQRPDARWDQLEPGLCDCAEGGYHCARAGDEVWVAAGTYAKTSATIPLVTLKEGVSLYGGFGATEATREQRKWTQNVTTLDGSGLSGYPVVLAGRRDISYKARRLHRTQPVGVWRGRRHTVHRRFMPGLGQQQCEADKAFSSESGWHSHRSRLPEPAWDTDSARVYFPVRPCHPQRRITPTSATPTAVVAP